MPPFEFRGNGKDRRPQPKHEFTFRYTRPATAERPLLTRRRETTPEQLVGTAGEKPAPKFTSLEALSDSEEADMDLSTDDDEDESSRPRKKRAFGLDGAESAAAPPPAPKWSNPDPYTILPPPDESRSNRPDIVKLIRKARVAANAKANEGDAVTANEDFISFGVEDEESLQNNAPENAPKGPRGMEAEPALSSRKRTRDDELKGYSKKLGKPASKFYPDASILDQWRALSPHSATPWMEHTAPALHMGARLHNEILSFYHWAKPQPFEQIVRADLVARLQDAFQKRYSGVQIRAFGSFASGLYLPTADIDLVLLSTTFMRKGIKTFGERKGQIYAFSAFIKGLNITVPNSIEVIAHARVPILKFVDKLTGLRVDLSFDNDSGLIANDTFQVWKGEYPVMPVLVSVVKQFLLLRGLNEVSTGGLGGFSITCLVTSLLQHVPHGHVQPNVGNLLMDFFCFYGNSFDYERVGVHMNPPGYFNKRIFKNNNDRLMIEDPNNPDNDISGGTKEIALIFRAFYKAYDSLRAAMVAQSMSGTPHTTILGTIIGANYDEYTEQRFQLRQVFEKSGRFDHYRSPPPPPPGNPPSLDGDHPPPPPRAPPPGPPPDPNYAQGSGTKQTGQQRQETQQRIGTQQAAVPPRPPAPAPTTAPISAPVAPQNVDLANAKAKPVPIDLTGDDPQASLSAPQLPPVAASESSVSVTGTFTPISSESPPPQSKIKPSQNSRRKRDRADHPDYPPASAPEATDTSSSESESPSTRSSSEARDDSTPPPVKRKRRANQRRLQACQTRAARMKRLRPDLRVPSAISLRQARLLAGHKTNAELEEDLSSREKLCNGTA